MRFILTFFLFCAFGLNIFGQNITVKEIKELGTDFTASKFERKDNNGKSCAVVKIALPSVEGVAFSNHVGEVSNKAGEYVVYISPGTTSLCILKEEEPICMIDFTKANLEIQSKHTYQVILNVEQIREMVFHILPVNATLTVNDQVIPLNEDGIGKVICDPETMYNYKVDAPDYISVEDAFMFEAEESALDPINISLDHKMGTVIFNCNVQEFEVIANNDSYGIIENGEEIQLPYGKNTLRLISEQYDDWTQEINVSEESSVISVTMEKANDVSNKLRSRTTIFAGGGFAYDFNKEIEMSDKNLRGNPVRVGLDYERFIKRWFTFRTGLDITVFLGDDFKVDKKIPFTLEVPLLFSLNIPLGKLNRHHFSLGLGPIIGYGYINQDSTATIVNEGNITKVEEEDNYDILAGGRLEARFTLNHLVLGAALDYHYYFKKAIAKDGLLVPMFTIGYKF